MNPIDEAIQAINEHIEKQPEKSILYANPGMKDNIPAKYHHLITFTELVNPGQIIEYFPDRKPQPKREIKFETMMGFSVKSHQIINIEGA